MKFDVRCGETASGTPIWKEGWVKALNYNDNTVTLEVKATLADGESKTSLGSDVDDKTVKLYSEDIFLLGSHTKVSTSTSMTTRSATQSAYLGDLQNKVATTHAVNYVFVLSNLLCNYQYKL